jgi:hypothetical protein
MEFAHLGRLLIALLLGLIIGFIATAIINMFFALQNTTVIAISISVATAISAIIGYIIGKNQKQIRK